MGDDDMGGDQHRRPFRRARAARRAARRPFARPNRRARRSPRSCLCAPCDSPATARSVRSATAAKAAICFSSRATSRRASTNSQRGRIWLKRWAIAAPTSVSARRADRRAGLARVDKMQRGQRHHRSADRSEPVVGAHEAVRQRQRQGLDDHQRADRQIGDGDRGDDAADQRAGDAVVAPLAGPAVAGAHDDRDGQQHPIAMAGVAEAARDDRARRPSPRSGGWRSGTPANPA